MSERVLLVDDDPNVLSGFQRQLRKRFRIKTALGGEQALELLERSGPFAVIVSDQRMPEMDGVTLLEEVRRRSPETVRLMLTGNADQETAQEAVNRGQVFRFLTKPCPPETLVAALEEALELHRSRAAERRVLEETLTGAIRLVTDVLSMAAPEAFDRALAVRDEAVRLARALGADEVWEVEAAAMLAPLATVTLPPETADRLRRGEPLSPEEEAMVEALPEQASRLLGHIPRLEGVARALLYQNKRFEGSGFPRDGVAGEAIPLTTRILQVAAALVPLLAQGLGRAEAAARLAEQPGRFDPRVVAAAGADRGAAPTVAEVGVMGLRPGQTLLSAIETDDGRLLFAPGHRITAAVIARLHNQARLLAIKEPIRVQEPAAATAPAAAQG